jgi:hypothetical protein
LRELGALTTVISAAHAAFLDRAYLKAHALFREALALPRIDEVKPQLVYDYLVTGYVGHALASDIQALRALIVSVQSEHAAYLERRAELTLLEAHQEVATRQASDEMLRENLALLAALHDRSGPDHSSSNLEGLGYRRLGERRSSGDDRSAHLGRAAMIFEGIHADVGDAMAVEHRNNWAITLVRRFELLGGVDDLDQAERILSEINFTQGSLTLTDYLALPKALNNLGNVFKQRVAISGDLGTLEKSLAQYAGAERFWNEESSPYEWAMLQKNRADARCAFMRLAGFDKLHAVLAAEELERALRYRTLERAPYQFERTMAVKRELEAIAAHSSTRS